MQAAGEERLSSEPSPAPTQAYSSRSLKRELSVDEHGYPVLLSEHAAMTADQQDDREPDGQTERQPVAEPVMRLQHLKVGHVPVSQASATAEPPKRLTESVVAWSKKPKISCEDEFCLQALGHEPAFFDQLTAAVAKRQVPSASAEIDGHELASTAYDPNHPKDDPAPKPKRAAKAKAKSAASTAGVDVTLPKVGKTKKLGNVKLGLFSAQSYITHVPVGSSKGKLVVAISKTQSRNHQALCQALFVSLLAKNFDKAAAVAERQLLLAADDSA